MILYHGSNIVVDKPQILQSERLLDFGAGFYTTTNKEQAIRWARKVCIRRKTKEQYISVYEFDLELAEKTLTVVRFDKPNEDWLNFICACRSGKDVIDVYDIVIGPVADDNVYATVQLFETGVLDKDETVKRLKIEQLYDQVLFHTEKTLQYCVFKESFSMGGENIG